MSMHVCKGLNISSPLSHNPIMPSGILHFIGFFEPPQSDQTGGTFFLFTLSSQTVPFLLFLPFTLCKRNRAPKHPHLNRSH